ncbi:MAG: helix-turn-helix domain-containing protein [Oscillospiraceae bacterium]|jgi:transcriptional regulator with XRE-family HTH domain|nr:helix-turn-helix domain-containing protein [Oscillospiraceae bacterium]
MELRLLALRREKQMTQDDVAKRLNISRQAYALYETNQRHMNYDSLRMLAELFAVSIDYLLGRDNRNSEYLTDDELELLRQYRTLDKRGQKTLQTLVAFERTQTKKPTA